MNKVFAFLIVCAYSACAFAQTIDASASKIEFKVSNLIVSSVEGEIKGMRGEVKFSPKNYSQGLLNVCVDPSTIFTDNEERDEHLMSDDFFAVPMNPEICFSSTSISKKGKGYVVTGNLTILGVTKTVSIPFQYNNQTFTGEFTLNRFDYGLAAVAYSGTSMVGEDVEVKITCVVK